MLDDKSEGQPLKVRALLAVTLLQPLELGVARAEADAKRDKDAAGVSEAALDAVLSADGDGGCEVLPEAVACAVAVPDSVASAVSEELCRALVDSAADPETDAAPLNVGGTRVADTIADSVGADDAV